jgi:hypothetical protein
VGRERGERAKRGHGSGQRLSSVRQVAGKGDGEGSGVASAWKRDRRREGGPGTAVGGRHRPVADGREWPMHRRVAWHRVGEAGSLTRGPKATVTGGAV